MRRSRKIVLAVVAGLLVALVGAVLYARPLLRTGTGYAAHNACAVVLVAGRDEVAARADLPPNPLVPLLRTRVDRTAGSATSTVLGLFGATAFHTTGLGCTLAEDRPDLQPPALVDVDTEGEWPVGERVPPPPPGVDVAALEAVLDDAFAEDDPEGRSRGTRAVVIVHDGRIVAERYADGFDPETPQLGWSMAKSVTNAMAGRLVAEGLLDVDDAGLLPAWADDDRADITVDDLLRMASGLEWEEAYELGSTITEMLYLREDMGAFAAEQPLVAEPGTVQQYSSGTTNILCDVLADRADRAGGGAGLARDLVFAPLGMSSAVLEPDAAGDPVCSSYLWATPRDWARFGLWFLRDGEWQGQRLLPDGWVEYSTSLSSTGRDGPLSGEDEGFGAHWWVNRTRDRTPVVPEAPEDTFYAAGHDGQRIFVVPSADLVVVRMGFTPEIDSADLRFGALVAGAVAAVGG